MYGLKPCPLCGGKAIIMAVIGFVKWRKNSEAETVKRINDALGIELYYWQVFYIFRNGEYHDELRYGRRNGKTTANALKLCLSNGEPIQLHLRPVSQIDYEIEAFAKEDAKNAMRLNFFADETFQIYKKLEAAGGITLREIHFYK